MKYSIAALALVASCHASPVTAQTPKCFQAEGAIKNMESHGFAITFGDTSDDPATFLAEDGNGNWVVFLISGDVLCPIAGGSAGFHKPKPPNT